MRAPSFTGIISPCSRRRHRWSRPCIGMKFQTRAISLHSARGALHHPRRRGENSFLVRAFRTHRTDSEIEKICSSHFIEPGDFDKPMSVRYWEDWFDIEGGPVAGGTVGDRWLWRPAAPRSLFGHGQRATKASTSASAKALFCKNRSRLERRDTQDRCC